MRLESIVRIAFLSGFALVATPLLHGDTAPIRQIRQNWASPEDAQSGQNNNNKTKQNGTAPADTTRQFHWKVITPSETQNGNGQMDYKNNGNGANQMNKQAMPSTQSQTRSFRSNTPSALQERSSRQPSSQNFNRSYWSPNQAQKMTGNDFDNSKKLKNAPAPLNSQGNFNAPRPGDATHPANYYKTEDKSLLQKAKENPSLSTFLSALDAAGLSDQLENGGPYTVFAPSNEAFRQLPKGTIDRLFRPENQRELYMIISYHIAPGKIDAKNAKTQKLRTLNGRDIDMETGRGTLTVDDAEVIRQDIQGQNGVIHVIDAVLLPPSK